MKKYLHFWPFLLLLLTIGAAVVVYLSLPHKFNGTTFDPPVTAPEFSIRDYQGKNFQLVQPVKSVTMLFFGYTSCPDICPAVMAQMKILRSRLGNQANNARFVFISVDPDHDTPEVVGKYIQLFDPAIIGITGTISELEPVWNLYGVYRQTNPNGSLNPEEIEHSARIYVIDKKNRLRVNYDYSVDTDSILVDLLYLIKERI
jgi:protein SCO1